MATESVLEGILKNQKLQYAHKAVNSTWVGEGLKQLLEDWSGLSYFFPRPYPTPVLIKAPTGTGKTTFIVQDLLKVAETRHAWVLLFVNRTALKNQILSDACKALLGYYLPPSVWTNIYQVKNLIVFTYQYFEENYWKLTRDPLFPQNIKYVVMDEAHFFASDALFNSQTQTILRHILQFSYQKQRIYMTATPEDVKDIIAYEEFLSRGYSLNGRNAEYEQQLNLETVWAQLPQSIDEYIFPSRPLQLNLRFFLKWDTVIDRIAQSHDGEKWLIFVSDSEDGEYLKSRLKKESVFVKSDRNKEALERIELLSSFDQKVLITTSVLDNGINIVDDMCCNVVIDSVASVQLLQMFGRKRKTENERINLYIRNKTDTEFSSYIKSVRKKISAIDSFENDTTRFFQEEFDYLDFNTRKMFHFVPEDRCRKVNGYAKYILSRRLAEFIHMERELKCNKNAFAEWVCRVFETPFDENMIIVDENGNTEDDAALSKIAEQVKQILLQYKDNSIHKKELTDLRDELQRVVAPVIHKINGGTCKYDNRVNSTVNKIILYFQQDEAVKYEFVIRKKLYHLVESSKK